MLRLTSICGLGQIAPAPIQSVMKHFPEMMREHLEDRHVPRRGSALEVRDE